MGIRLLRGRTFTARDQRDATPVVVIDQALARATFGTIPCARRQLDLLDLPTGNGS